MVRLRLSGAERHLVEWTALRDRMRRVLSPWREMPDGTPSGDDVGTFIESLGAQDLTSESLKGVTGHNAFPQTGAMMQSRGTTHCADAPYIALVR